jgi:hypothetical protein
MTLPTLSINGTHKTELFAAAEEARNALQVALKAFQKTEPNGRDYQYADPEAFENARLHYQIQCMSIEVAIDYLETLMEHTQ